MRLATITNWAYGATLVLTLASGTTMILAARAQERERTAVAQRYELDRATATVDEDVGELSDFARQYAISGNPADLVAYQHETAALLPVEQRTRQIRDAGAGADELAALHEAMRWADGLQGQQQAAVAARLAGDRDAAVAALFAPEYERELDRIQASVERFQYRIDQRTQSDLEAAIGVSKLWRGVSEAMLAITGLLFLFVLYFIFRRRVLHPVVKLSDVVARLAAQDYDAQPPHYDRIDEIGDMAQALRVFRENGIERQRLEQERDADRAMRDLLSRMTQRMQGCDTIGDLARVIERFVPEVAPHLAGGLYLLDRSRNVLVQRCAWLDPRHSRPEFPSMACWALRRGSPHRSSGDHVDVPCGHLLPGTAIPDTICLPLTAQHGVLGLLYLEPREATTSAAAAVDEYIDMLVENIGLALDNLRLREALRDMAMADPLTGLANRRQLEMLLEREIAEAARDAVPLACVMIDIDHFKHFNDEFGHDAGDAVLKAVGAALRRSVREEHLVFRYGGEEFLLLMPGVGPEEAARRAEQIRRLVASLAVAYDRRDLGAITISLGVASTPAHCPAGTLVQAADAALLRAKRGGRDRVELAVQRRPTRAEA